jgi:metallo-beta-lactamase family protein
MDISFHGAAQTVTGTQHLLSVNGKRILLDCGLYQGPRQETFDRNRRFGYDPRSVDVLIVSHAHTDHVGNIPSLVKNGYSGPIIATPATHDLANFMIRDSARIQESDAEYLNKKRARNGEPPIEPIYDSQDAEAALKLFTTHKYDEPFEAADGVTARFVEAGHILGSASIVLDIKERSRSYRFAFSGDIGRKGMPILNDPVQLAEVDYVIMESTYGNRLHKPPSEAHAQLQKVMRQAIERGGKVIVPAFAVGRSQELIYALHKMMEGGDILRLPIYVDSPLAVNVSKVFGAHPELYDAEARGHLRHDGDGNLFTYRELNYVSSVDESKALNDKPGPMVIISASGMCETGRVLHHLRNNIENPRNTILIVSWQAPDTLGRRLVEKTPRVKIFGEPYTLKANVEVINGFSAHADQAGLSEWALALKGRLKKVFLVHGEPEPAEALAAKLREGGLPEVQYPKWRETVSV